MSEIVYKILSGEEWRTAQRAGVFQGSAVDERDGYIHLSSVAQVRETAARHFAGQRDLVLLSVDGARCPPGSLRWEVSRGGQLFPHLYVPLSVQWVLAADPLPSGPDGHLVRTLGR